jgi:cyclase
MLRPRIIPCLLIRDKGLVKTEKFNRGKYIGDPLNAVRIFNEKEVDELMIIDIDATVEGRKPDFNLIKKLAVESRMPLCYGGGIKTIEDAKKIINMGVEKIAISSLAIEKPLSLRAIVNAIGLQSLVVIMDVKKRGFFKKYEVVYHNGRKGSGLRPIDYAKKLEDIGIGELVINNVDYDGCMNGYDVDLIDKIRLVTSMPLTVLGGAGSYNDLKFLIDRFKIIGAAAGSIFVFKGKYKAVLIQYPTFSEKQDILGRSENE